LAVSFVPRRQLAEIGAQIGDYQFVSILQYFLNGVGQITFGPLHIVAPREDDADSGPIVKVCEKFEGRMEMKMETYLPDGPMPGNIRNFQSITLRFANNILTFLSKIRTKNKKIFAQAIPVTSRVTDLNWWLWRNQMTIRN
jgi:hypothetical protein